MKKRWILCLAMLLALAMLFSACGGSQPAPSQSGNESSSGSTNTQPQQQPEAQAKKPVVAYLLGKTSTPYCSMHYDVFMKEVENYSDVEWLIFDANLDATTQQQQAEEAIAMNVDCIAMFPVDSVSQVATAKEIHDAGIPLIIVDTKLDSAADDYITCFFGPDNEYQASLVADALHEVYPDGMTFVYMGLDESNAVHGLRLGGFQKRSDEMGYGFDLLDVSPNCGYQTEQAKAALTAMLARYPGQIDVVYTIDDGTGYGALQALQEDTSGFNTNTKIASIGGTEAGLNAIKNTDIYLVDTYQSPRIEVPGFMSIAYDIVINNKYPEQKQILMDIPVITAENIDEWLEVGPAY